MRREDSEFERTRRSIQMYLNFHLTAIQLYIWLRIPQFCTIQLFSVGTEPIDLIQLAVRLERLWNKLILRIHNGAMAAN